jgi:hypothetical protein
MDQSRNARRLYAAFTTNDSKSINHKESMDVGSFKDMKKFIPVSYHKSFKSREQSRSGIYNHIIY